MGIYRRRGRPAGGVVIKHERSCAASDAVCMSPWILPITCSEAYEPFDRMFLRARPYTARRPTYVIPPPESDQVALDTPVSCTGSDSGRSQKKAKRGSREEEEGSGQESREVRRRCDYVPREVIHLPSYSEQIPALCGFIGNILR
eukprot:Hpha_TRINITY_DN15141_c0_g3::TRINITY_DN15141_c0_g3_i2::g.128775::m.128775